MATNHNININLRSGAGGSNLKTSAKKNLVDIKTKNISKISNFHGLKLGKALASGKTLGALKTLGLAGAITAGLVTTANKVLEIGMDIYTAKSGEQLAVGNIRRTKNYVFNPVKYVVDDLYRQGFLQASVIKRQNQANDYYRELTGKAIVGNQYGNKR